VPGPSQVRATSATLPFPYATPGARRRALAAWCLYDFASSSYTTLIVTVSFSVYFREVVIAQGNRGDLLWGLANFLAMLVVALVSPVLGAMADGLGRKRTLLQLATCQSVAATALLYFAAPGRAFLSMACYIVATIGFEAAYVFYNAYLPEVSTPRTMGRTSGWGWGIGFVGGLAALLLCSPWIGSELRDARGELVPHAIQDRRLSFAIVAAFYLVFAIPALALLRDAPAARSAVPGALRQGLASVMRTLRQIGRHREVGKFVLASLLFNDAISTVIVFAATYATVTFEFGSGELVRLFVIMNLVAFPATVLSGYLADRAGAKRTLVLSLVLWILVVLLAASASTKLAFWVVALGAAVGMGATQAVARSLMAALTPPERRAEFFGFYVTAGKFAAISGPLIFGALSAATGSQRIAVLALLPLFLGGLALTLAVAEPGRPAPPD